MSSVPIADMARREVEALHAFFVEWFRDTEGTVDFSRCERSLAPDFRMVAPDGRVRERAVVIERLRQARGSGPQGFAIAIVDPRPVWQGREAVLLEYIEQQYGEGSTTRRRSCGFFTHEPSAPHCVVWRHLQETWMAEEKNV